ncbi:hypothetical protein, variant [Verruconis gallopava]|nr:hypothetical protein, variant [Verruconis gallopava]KIW06761.1 hypothetical protein, variant [Verruconis gallopava]
MLGRSGIIQLRWPTSGVRISRSYRQIKPLSTATDIGAPSSQKSFGPWHNRRLSRLWTPTGGVMTSETKQGDATALLVQAGYIRQTQSGIFHYLPMASHLEDMLQQKLAWHLEVMLNASRVSLSALSSEDLWRRSGRIGKESLSTVQHQFLTVNDRKKSHMILSPTHEEEITTLVANDAKSYHDFPLRLYQINRKYRDELRPRHGLLRTKEFMMKDLYTFDLDETAAMKTYEDVRETYRTFFRRLGLPVIEAKASSGDMGGNLSHEFHILSESGEDTLHICRSCGFAENEEVTMKPSGSPIEDYSCPQCSSKSMSAHNAIEVGHTFHLGTRYSEPLGAVVEVPMEVQASESDIEGSQSVRKTKRVPLQMGCHGIGVSRLLGATATLYSDSKGLRWPLHFHPIGAMIIIDGPANEVPGLSSIYNAIHNIQHKRLKSVFPFTAWVDDRNRSFAWKLKDADLVGYPITIVLGRKWRETGEYEIKCRFNPSLSITSKYLVDSLLGILNSLNPEAKNSNQYLANHEAHGLEKAAAVQHPTYVPEDILEVSAEKEPRPSEPQYLVKER